MKNSSGIRPMEYQVLVEPKRVEEKTTGGLFIPDSRKEKDQFAMTRGTLIATSPLAFTYSAQAGDVTPQIGQTVVFPKYQGFEVEGADGETYWLMEDKNILAVIEK